jgi:hypothetical protein
MTRRHWLVLGLGGLIVSAATRRAAAGPTQIEAEGYAGSSAGQWTCGPTARATYAGVGGHVRVYPEDEREPSARVGDEASHPDLEPHGFSIGGGAGAEQRAFERLDCASACDAADKLPETRILGAGRANVGWDWDYFGVHAGALGFQRWKDNTDLSPTSYILPDFDLRFGRRAGFHGGLGFGAYSVSTIFRPGAYVSLGYASGAWAAELRGGLHLVFDSGVGPRVDLSTRYAVSRVVAPGIGFAVSSDHQVSPEGRLFVVFTP